ncbi:uncharacterized protein SCHCODRAFT_02552316 [Schizophyllum commune H4-8]|nr:uncharacterized protein SCHCODRAFT_02552316 [Schizophyllum commune H4-8]KAI5887416.1 hypothetical protein SCHCODRAFT_02552316 [Schizophyllum commune H4-8]
MVFCHTPHRGSAAASAFAVSAIRAAVCEQSAFSSRDWLNLAQLSRAWQDVAEEHVWEKLDSVIPLLRLLPQDAWTACAEECMHDFTAPRLSLLRLLRPEDWTSSLRRRAGYVKDLRLSPFDLSLEDQRKIIECPINGNWFPRLRALTLRGDPSGLDVVDDNFLALFLSPSITQLTCEGMQGWPISNWKILVFSRCPRLSCLTMIDTFDLDILGGSQYGAFRPMRFFRSFLDATQSCATLTHATLMLPYSRDLVLSLAACPALKNLAWTSDPGQYLPHATSVPYPSFPSLRCLDFDYLPMWLARSIIEAGLARPMETIIVRHALCTQSEFERAVAATARCCLPDTLTVFALKKLGWSLKFAQTSIVGRRDTLAALAVFHNLESVYIGTLSIEPDWADAECWWPRLRRIYPSIRSGMLGEAGATMEKTT